MKRILFKVQYWIRIFQRRKLKITELLYFSKWQNKSNVKNNSNKTKLIKKKKILKSLIVSINMEIKWEEGPQLEIL